MSIKVFYPGSFDPVTFGHIDLIARAARLFGAVTVGIGVHHAKKTLLSADERQALLQDAVGALPERDRIWIATFDGLVVDAALSAGSSAILRGLRDGADFDYEMQMAGMNGAMAAGLDTVFLPAASEHRHIAATFVRQIAQMGGDISAFAPPAVADKLKQKLAFSALS